MKKLLLNYAIYLFRWQLSTPILSLVLMLFGVGGSPIIPTVVANLVGGIIFFWVDKWIFNRKPKK